MSENTCHRCHIRAVGNHQSGGSVPESGHSVPVADWAKPETGLDDTLSEAEAAEQIAMSAFFQCFTDFNQFTGRLREWMLLGIEETLRSGDLWIELAQN